MTGRWLPPFAATAFMALCAIFARTSTADEPPAAAPLDPAIKAGASWWSFQPIQRPAVPKSESTASGPPRNPIDAFIRHAQAEQGIAPAPEADRLTLIRR